MGLIEILRICLEEQLLINYYMIKHLILLKLQNVIDIKEVLFQWLTKFFDKKSSVGAVKCADKFAIKSEILTNQQLAKELQIIYYQKI